MIGEINKNIDDILFEGFFEQSPISCSSSDLSAAIPKVNFRKIKLTKFQNLYNSFIENTKIPISFDSESFEFKLSTSKKKVAASEVEALTINPLRKKVDKDDILKSQEEEPQEITFNIESQIIKQEEDVIISPEIVPKAVPQEEILSVTDESNKLVWPPKKESKQKKGLDKLSKKIKTKKNKKPYFIQEDKIEEKEKPTEKKIEIPKLAQKEKTFTQFPWATAEQDYEALETIFQGGLESELVDESINAPSQQKEKEKPSGVFVGEQLKPTQTDVPQAKAEIEQNESDPIIAPAKIKKELVGEIVFKAFTPEVATDFVSDIIKGSINPKDIKLKTVFDKDNTVDFDKGDVRKAQNMFEKYGGSKVSPVRIIIIGGVAATIGYLFWSYGLPQIERYISGEQEENNIIVKDLFKQSEYKKKKAALYKSEIADKSVLQEEESFKPISESERLSLIEKARETLESRLDPFGQEHAPDEAVDAPPGASPTSKPAPDIQLQRKQLELVGIISAENKNLALVNVYLADFAVKADDDKTIRETKLKAALGMAVPNRVEVSILDPLEDWYVKQILKSKSRSEDPTIELVKGDKKFKLRVGQKVLLPEDKTFEEIKEEAESKLLSAPENNTSGSSLKDEDT